MPPRASPTHFLCIPLSSPQLRRSLASFHADVTSINSFALPQDAIRPPGTLHLTLGVMSLPRPDQVEQALTLLRHMRLRDIVKEARTSLNSRRRDQTTPDTNGNIVLSIKGLHAMQSPSKTSVLYAPPLDTEGGTLYEACKLIKRRFVDSGLMVDDGRALLLHVTVVNTIYVKGRGRGKKMEIDARDVLSRYEDYDWADGLEIRRLALCKMGAQRDGDDAFYVEEGHIAF